MPYWINPLYAEVVEKLRKRLIELRREANDPDLKYEYPI